MHAAGTVVGQCRSGVIESGSPAIHALGQANGLKRRYAIEPVTRWLSNTCRIAI